MAVPNDLLTEATHALLRTDYLDQQRGWFALKPTPEVAAKWGHRLRRLLAAGLETPAAFAGPEGRRLEQECVRALIDAVQLAEDRPRFDLPLSSRGVLVDRAEELMRAHLQDALGAIDLCAILGTSDRTLRQAFRERYGLGPMVYYKSLRLNAVRTALKAAGTGPIADIAQQWGFLHQGNFAADYHRAFGEHPSQTINLRRTKRG